MSEVFDALPGIEVSVAEISTALASMWKDSAAHGADAPADDDARAIQVNVILHLGFGTKPDDALVKFKLAVEFSSRYPSRVVILCPRIEDGNEGMETRAKIYGECFLGRSKGDTRCCEFVILEYSFVARNYIENQVSVCLTSDLPTYFWAHHFTDCRLMADYQSFFTRSRRFIFDSAAAPLEAVTFPWPNPANVRDLAYARMLPVRQSIGQFLSRYEPGILSGGLRRVKVSYEAVHTAEGRALMRWVRSRLVACGAGERGVVWLEGELPHKGGTCFEIEFMYHTPAKRFKWRGDCDTGVAGFSADLGTGPMELPSHIKLLAPTQALSEAMFF
ncbi:glucose-6-phosphate dehydrogenase subunit [mine drainage metagenome]|uniref:Glucose-6-phosphate dehydrogenase subunit n=1 Tax=mine drainage metagenome TaxID=410659 RepID=A0A1J5RRB7_9ZZZZ